MTRAKEMRDLPLAIDVDSNGKVLIGQTGTGAYSSADNLILGTGSGHNGMTIFSGNAHQGTIFFADALGGDSDASTYDGYIIYQHDDGALRIGTRGAERIRIDSNGIVGIGTNAPGTTDSGYNYGALHVHNQSGSGSQVRWTNSATGTGTSAGFMISKWSDKNTYLTNFDDGAKTIFTQSDSSGNLDSTVLVLDGDGKVGIGTASPLRNLSVIGSDTSSSGYKDIVEFLEPNTTGGTVSVNFGVANSLNNLGKVDFTYVGAGSTDNWVSIGFHSNDNKLKVYANGLVEVASYLKSKKGTIQTVIKQQTNYTSANPVNTWAEVNSNFRVDITPRFSSGTKILGTYSIPMNPTGAANILMAIQPWYSTDGGTTKTLLNQGGPAGSRLTGSHSWFRSSNGYDGNDMQNHIVHFGHTHSSTTTLTWGFYFRSEGSNTTYFCYSNGNSSLWGWTAPIYMELREVEVA